MMTVEFLELKVVADPTSPQCSEKLDLKFVGTNRSETQLIAVKELIFTLPLGNLPSTLATDLTSAKFISPDGWTVEHGSGQITFKPKTENSGKIGPKGLEFQIQQIEVNDKPGTADIKMVQILEPLAPNDDPPRHESPPTPLTKVSPTLFLKQPTISAPKIDYGGSNTVTWDASQGAVISLQLGDEPPITSIKDNPDNPLHHSGSYTFDNIQSGSSTIVVQVTASATNSASPPITKQVVLGIKPPVLTMDVTATQPQNSVPVALLEWTTTGATSRTLSSVPAGVHAPTGYANGTAQTPFVIPTSYTMDASNPAYAEPATVTKLVEPPATDWFWVGPGPFASDSIVTIHSSHCGLIALESLKADPGDGYMWTSVDGLNWSKVTTPPLMQFDRTSFFANFGTTTYLSTFKEGVRDLYASTDLNNWQELPSFPYGFSVFGAPSIVFDSRGTAWATAVQEINEKGKMRLVPALYKSTNNMQSWEFVGNPSLTMFIRPFLNPGLAFFNGQLWLLNENTIMSSSDGIDWTEHGFPSYYPLSCYSAVHNEQICFFLQPSDSNSMPTQLVRVDRNANTVIDPPAPSFNNTTPNPFTALSIAEFNGTLFTVSNGFFEVPGGQPVVEGLGVWARTI